MRYLRLVPILFLGAAAFGLYKVNQELDNNPTTIENNQGAANCQPGAANTPVMPEIPNVQIPNKNDSSPKAQEVNTNDVKDTKANSPVSQPRPAAVTLSVPFLSQAPFGDWKDPRQQDGCEEASAIMAMLWVKNENAVTKDFALSKILDIAAYEDKNYGSYHDTSAEDTAIRILKGYYNFTNYEIKKDATLDDIKNELAKGNLIVAPMDGKALKNPNFTGGGPDRHMLVVKGYDDNAKQFITNDPGTRKGEGYRYGENLLYGAIRDYTSGYHAPIAGEHKTIIVIKK